MKELLENFAEVEENVSLVKLNTYHIGGMAKYLVKPNSINDLVEVLKVLKENNIDYFILGNGSNIVLNSKFYEGAVIKLDKINGIEVSPELNTAYAEAGAMIGKVTLETVNKGLTGLEFAAGIPGTVGGCIYGNAGAYNACIMDYVESVTVIDEDFNINIIKHEDIEYGYRTTMFKEQKKYVIVAAKFYLKIGDKANSLEMIKERQERRAATQPLEYPSAGSVFRNPEGDFAGRLIEELGYKGKKIGGAMVSLKHANFIVNAGHAKGEDIKKLILEIKDKVKEKYNIDLKCEQEFVNWE
jgi:UDP-N-acetylmuramate dehydrogenase